MENQCSLFFGDERVRFQVSEPAWGLLNASFKNHSLMNWTCKGKWITKDDDLTVEGLGIQAVVLR